MEARYLRDLLQKVLRKPVFLDSQNLMRGMGAAEVRQCDVVVLLATENVLLRPYCLLELWIAQRFGVPIVTFIIAARGFDWGAAHRILSDIGAALDSSSGDVSTISNQLKAIVTELGAPGEKPPSLRDFGLQILSALMGGCSQGTGDDIALSSRRRAHEGSSRLPRSEIKVSEVLTALTPTFHPWGTDNGVMADVSDLLDQMHNAVGRMPPHLAAKLHARSLQRRQMMFALRSASGMLSARLSLQRRDYLGKNVGPKAHGGALPHVQKEGGNDPSGVTVQPPAEEDRRTPGRNLRKGSKRSKLSKELSQLIGTAITSILHVVEWEPKAGAEEVDGDEGSGVERESSAKRLGRLVQATNAAALAELAICCAREEAKTVEAALFLSGRLDALFGGTRRSVLFDPLGVATASDMSDWTSSS